MVRAFGPHLVPHSALKGLIRYTISNLSREVGVCYVHTRLIREQAHQLTLESYFSFFWALFFLFPARRAHTLGTYICVMRTAPSGLTGIMHLFFSEKNTPCELFLGILYHFIGPFEKIKLDRTYIFRINHLFFSIIHHQIVIQNNAKALFFRQFDGILCDLWAQKIIFYQI